jgi:LPS export ABC transporter protein LptC
LHTRGRGLRRLVGALRSAAFVFAVGCNSSFDLLENGGTHTAPVELPPIEMEGVIFEGYHGDLRDLSVTADSATVDLTAHVANLRQVSMGFSDEDASKVDISAPVGVFHLDADDFSLSNGVRGSTGEGERFTTAAAHYVASRRVIASDSPVELHRSNLVLTASGMELEVATHKLRLTGNVRARVQPK